MNKERRKAIEDMEEAISSIAKRVEAMSRESRDGETAQQTCPLLTRAGVDEVSLEAALEVSSEDSDEVSLEIANVITRLAVRAITEKLSAVVSEAERLLEEERGSFENTPWRFQNGYRGTLARDAINLLEDGISSLLTAKEELESTPPNFERALDRLCSVDIASIC